MYVSLAVAIDFFIDVLAVSVVLLVGLLGKCGKSGVDSLVMDFHRM